MKFKSRVTIVVIGVFSILIMLTIGFFIERNLVILFENNTWNEDLGYEDNEIYNLSFNLIGDRSCPEIPIDVGNNEFGLMFDTGCGAGILFTNVVEDKIDYTLLNKTEALNRDGSHRGWNKGIKIDEIKVFGEAFKNITTSVADWSMFSSTKFNGLIGLSYFDSKVITLDYADNKIGVSSNPIDYTKLEADKYVVLPLYKATTQGQQDLLFFEAECNDQPIIVYLDTGKNYSYLYNPDCSTVIGEKPDKVFDIPLKIGSMKLMLKDMSEVNDIAQADGLPYPTMIELNSDQIWKCNLLVTIDLIEKKIIFSKL